MAPFHDETEVRLAAYNAMVEYAYPAFADMREVYYDVDTTYSSFDEFAKRYEGHSYNNYEKGVRQSLVQ